MNPLNYNIKIELYGEGDCKYHVEEVVYYRYDFPTMMMYRWRWYFEYLAALVKVAYPHRKVNLIIHQNTDGYLAGKDYIERKSESLLKSLRGQLKRLENKVYVDDLFSTESEKIEDKKARIQQEIASLEKGEFTRWCPGTYKNTIKQTLENSMSYDTNL